MEAKRIEISALLRAGHKQVDIVKMLNVSLSTEKRVANRLKIMQGSKFDLVLTDCKLFNGREFEKSFKRI